MSSGDYAEYLEANKGRFSHLTGLIESSVAELPSTVAIEQAAGGEFSFVAGEIFPDAVIREFQVEGVDISTEQADGLANSWNVAALAMAKAEAIELSTTVSLYKRIADKLQGQTDNDTESEPRMLAYDRANWRQASTNRERKSLTFRITHLAGVEEFSLARGYQFEVGDEVLQKGLVVKYVGNTIIQAAVGVRPVEDELLSDVIWLWALKDFCKL